MTVEDSARPLLQLSKEDIECEIRYWSTSVFCYMLGANPPSSVVSGFVKRVWQSHGVDKVSFLPNGIFIVRFKTKEQQQQVLNTGHLLFDSKLVIIKEWSPDVALIKHDVKQVSVWMKLYGLEIKFWGKECLKKLSGEFGKFIKCDEATSKRSFFGYARILVEVQIGQNFPKELSFVDELGLLHKLRVDYDWPPVSCVQCKGMGHVAVHYWKGEGKKLQRKVWKTRTQTVKPAPVVTPIVTPVVPVPKQFEMSSFPRRILTRMMRQEAPESRQPSVPGMTFMDSLNMIISRSVCAGKHGLRKIQAENETKIRGSNWIKAKNVVCDSWAICTNSSYHKGGRIWSCQFLYTLVYGFNKDKERESLWKSLVSIGKGVDSRWMVCGDFNILMDMNERIGGAEVQWHNVLPMKQMAANCDLTELKSIGAFFTWNNKHENGSKFYSKIDRVLINAEWLNDFPDCYANFLPEGHSETKILEYSLKQLDSHNFSDIQNITHVTEVALEGFQKQLRLDPLNQELCTAENACAQELKLLKSACAQYLQQKTEIQGAFEEYYVTLLGTSKPVVPVNMDVVRQGACLTSEHQDILQAPVTEDEIKTLLYSPFLDVIAAVKNVFSSGKLLKACNATVLTLIPKVDVPEHVTQFRPIACCSTIYKCVTKVICNRLSSILPNIISPYQSDFINGRDIVGNVLICQDLIRLYRRKACSPRIMMKIDLQKAYDSVE
ncbi:uncharacterized protein LOC141602034 [Silene latifolia]|uniref:uncharacterized protein LOC141602034 n=1 Tax=Silene latifolia TaxID=37657 RepID=UPI003D76A4B8